MNKVRAFFRIVHALCVFIVLGFALTGAAYVGGIVPERIKEVEVEKLILIERTSPTLRELLETIPPDYDVPVMVAFAVANQESGGRMDAIRFEPGQMSRAAKFTRDPEKQKMLSSSHCALQVMGYNAARLGISWSDLYVPETCVKTAMVILKECLDRHKGKPKYEQLYGALTCYNGSEKYAQAILSRIGRALIEESL